MESEVQIRPAPVVPETARDEPAIKEVINKVKSQGLFDQFRKECIADVDTKPAYHNLIQRVESYVEHFLQGQKWSLSANKNQLRETLRRQLHNSGMMQNGVERIIEQVVNPKILLGIKPKIDEAVSDHLGIDLKTRQEEQQRRKQEQQKLLLQQMQQQQHVQSHQNQNAKNGEPVFPIAGSTPPAGTNPWVNSGMANFPSPSVPGAPLPGCAGGNPQTMGGNFPGMVPPFSLMPGWMPGFNPGSGIAPMMPGQPMIPAFPGAPPGVASPVAGMGARPLFNASSAAAVTHSASTTTRSIMSSPQTGRNISTSTPAIPGQMPLPNLSQPPPVLPIPDAPVTSRIGASPGISPMVPPGTSPLAPPGTSPLAPPGTSPVAPPGTSRVVPAPHSSIPPPPGTVPISDNVPVKSNTLPGTPHIPALLSHTLAKVSEDELTPEKIAVFKTAAAFITKTVNNAGGAASGDLASIFSPRVLAEAMMEDCGKPMTKAEMRAVKRKERIKEIERLEAEKKEKLAGENENQGKIIKLEEDDKENPLPPQKHNLMDVFQGAEDVSDDEEALDMLLDIEETSQEAEDKHKRGIVLSEEEDLDKDAEKHPTCQRGKTYNFAWDVDMNSGDVTDVTVSSVHTSDMSSFEDDEEENMLSDILSEEGKIKESICEKREECQFQETVIGKEMSATIERPLPEHDPEAANSDQTDEKAHTNFESEVEKTKREEGIQIAVRENVVEGKDTAVEELKENMADVLPQVNPEPAQAKMRVITTQVELPAKPRRLLALSYNYSDSDDDETRDERKARIAREKEERYLKRQQRRAELDAKKKERDEEKTRLKREKQVQETSGATEKPSSAADTSLTDAHSVTCSPTSFEADSSAQTTPRKRKNKAEMKEQMLQQKVFHKKAALRRKRTRNRRYASDEFTSIFSDHKKLSQSYTDGANQEEFVTFEGDGTLEIVEMTVDQECVVETVGEEIETSNLGASESGKDLVLQCPSPYSDISDRSMSERSEPENVSEEDGPGVDQVSSDDDLGDLEEVKIVEEMEECSSKGHVSPHQSVSESDVGQVSSEAAMIPETSHMSARSKSNLFQDEIESVVSSQSVDKRKASGTSHTQEEIESQDSQLESSIKSPVQSLLSDAAEIDNTTSKMDDATTVATDSPTKDIMGELELEPVSDEDSLGGLDEDDAKGDKVISREPNIEKGKSGEPDKDEINLNNKASQHLSHTDESKTYVDTRKLLKSFDENTSDEGEIKSESEKEDEKEDVEEKRRRAANRKPIHQVDFGEAARRARVARGIFNANTSGDSQDWRGRSMGMNNPSMQNYRGGFSTWTPSGSPTVPQYGTPKTGNRYSGHEPVSPIRIKSPGTFDAESENSSHSRSSVRVRDDVPPPYPIEGVNMSRKHLSPASGSDDSVDYKPVSPPSPVSSSSSRARSRSRPRSKSSQSSRSSSCSSLSAASLSRKRTRSKRSIRKKRQRERQRRSTSLSPHNSPPLKPPLVEKNVSPKNSLGRYSPASNPIRSIHLSSGNESISSDELPNFSDDDIVAPVKQKSKQPRSDSFSSGYSLSKRPKNDSPGSISSSELIYSPTRIQPASGSDSSSSLSKKTKNRKRRRSSSLKSDQSSDFPPVSPIRDSGSTFSPHHPSSPISCPPLPADMSGFQPPLPQEPMPDDQPPLPPQPPSPPPTPGNQPSISEEEEGECPSTPEQPVSQDGDGSDAHNNTCQRVQNYECFDKTENNMQVHIVESTDVPEVCGSKKEDSDIINSDVNKNFPSPTAATSLPQSTSLLAAVSHTESHFPGYKQTSYPVAANKAEVLEIDSERSPSFSQQKEEIIQSSGIQSAEEAEGKLILCPSSPAPLSPSFQPLSPTPFAPITSVPTPPPMSSPPPPSVPTPPPMSSPPITSVPTPPPMSSPPPPSVPTPPPMSSPPITSVPTPPPMSSPPPTSVPTPPPMSSPPPPSVPTPPPMSSPPPPSLSSPLSPSSPLPSKPFSPLQLALVNNSTVNVEAESKDISGPDLCSTKGTEDKSYQEQQSHKPATTDNSTTTGNQNSPTKEQPSVDHGQGNNVHSSRECNTDVACGSDESKEGHLLSLSSRKRSAVQNDDGDDSNADQDSSNKKQKLADD